VALGVFLFLLALMWQRFVTEAVIICLLWCAVNMAVKPVDGGCQLQDSKVSRCLGNGLFVFHCTYYS